MTDEASRSRSTSSLDDASPSVSDEVELAADATAPRRARAFVGSFARNGLGGVVDNAQLLVSELVSNVVRHTNCDSMTLTIEIHAEAVHVEVCDCDTTRYPSIAPLRPTEPGGIGLRIVDELAHEWGTHETDHGKCVWFDLMTGPPPTTSRAGRKSA